jgi:hypothetical protein
MCRVNSPFVDDPQVVVVEDGDGAGLPRLLDLREDVGEVDGRGHGAIDVRGGPSWHVT